MRNKILFLACLMAVLLCIVSFSTEAFAWGTRTRCTSTTDPIRISSNGMSIDRAVNAVLIGDNLYASWVNGYYGFWQMLFDLPPVYSHNLKIRDLFRGEYSSREFRNYMEAESGATSLDFIGQAEDSIGHSCLPTYVTVFMGVNDICAIPIEKIDTESERIAVANDFKNAMRFGLQELAHGLPDDATVYVIGIPDITQIPYVIESKKALGFIDCDVVWALFTNIDPCENMFYQDTSDLIMLFNDKLEKLVAKFGFKDPSHKYYYTDAVYAYSLDGIDEEEISDIDCWHPSWIGQNEISDLTWNDLIFKNPPWLPLSP